MGELEGQFSGGIHLDNIAPCFLGGLQLITNSQQYPVQQLPFFENWFIVVAYSGINIPTKEARDKLPKSFLFKASS